MLAPNAGISVLSIPATQSILSPNVLLKFKCQLLAQRKANSSMQRPVMTKRTSQKRHFDMIGRQSMLTSLPFKPNYSPLKWTESLPPSVPRTASGNNLAALSSESEFFGNVPPLHPTSSFTHHEEEDSFLNLSDLPSQLPRSPYVNMPEMAVKEEEPFSPFSPVIKQEAMKQEPEYDFAREVMPDLAVKSEVAEEEEQAQELDAAMKVAMILVKTHEAGYEMDSLTTQLQIAMLRNEH